MLEAQSLLKVKDEDWGIRALRFLTLWLLQFVVLLAMVANADAGGSTLSQGLFQSESPPTSAVYLYAGESVIKFAEGLQRVAVGDSSVADVRVLEDNTFLLNGVGAGYTTLMIWDEVGLETIDLVVTARPHPDLRYIGRLVETWNVQPSWWGEYLVLQGRVSSEANKEAVENLVKSLWDPVISLVTVEKATEQPAEILEEPVEHCLAQEIEAALGIPEITVQVIKDLAILEGQVKAPLDRLRAAQIARQFMPEVLNLIELVELSDRAALDLEPIDSCEVAVVSHELPRVIEDIETLCDLWGYSLRTLGDILVLEGEIYDSTQKSALINLLEAHGLSYVDVTTKKAPSMRQDDLAALRTMLKELPGLRDITVSQKGRRLILEGCGQDAGAIELAEVLAQDYGTPAEMEVVNLIQMPAVQAAKPSASLIRAQMGIPGLVVRWVGNTLVLEGSLDPKSQMAAVDLASQYSSQVVNLISDQGLSALTIAEIEGLITADGVEVMAVGDNVVVKGEVSSPEQKETMLALASAYGYPVIDGITVSHEDEEVPPITAADVEKAIQLEKVTAKIVNGTIVLQGMVDDPRDQARAKVIADTYGREVVDLIEVTVRSETVEHWEPLVKAVSRQGAQLYKVASIPVVEGAVTPQIGAYLECLLDSAFDHWVNGLTIVHPPPVPLPSLDLVEAALGNPDITCQYVGDTLVLQGSVKSDHEQIRLEKVASLFEIPVQSLLTVKDEIQQVWVDVWILELSSSHGLETGVEWDLSLSEGEQVPIDQLPMPAGPSDETGDQRQRRAFGMMLGPVSAEVQLRSMLRSGEARILASPSLLTENRKQAQFLAGGEIPIPAELQGIEWKSYGVGLMVTPTILENGSIHLQVEPEVSSLDWENGIQLEHALIPGVRTRRWRTQAIVEPGKALVIGGLLSEEENTRQRQVPVLGDLPILGALFRSQARTRQETDLVVFVSPRLVQAEDHLWPKVLTGP